MNNQIVQIITGGRLNGRTYAYQCGLKDRELKALQKSKTRHWAYLPKYKDIAWYCSECKHFTTKKHNYCPNCGIRMVEPQESEG